MTYRVGPKGQVVIPKAIRDQLDIHPGDEVTVDEEAGEIRIRPLPQAATHLRGMLSDVAGSMTGALEASRQAERRRERAKAREGRAR